jgi:hypothetical protein
MEHPARKSGGERVNTQPISDERLAMGRRLAENPEARSFACHRWEIEELLAALVAVQKERDELAELLRYEPHQRDGNFVDFTFHVDTLAAVSSPGEEPKTEDGASKARVAGKGR